MKTILIILAIMAGLLMIVYIPWLIGGAAVVVFCFWNEWYIAGVIAGLFAIFCQIVVGSSVWDDVGSYSSSDEGSSGGDDIPEMFIAYKFGERNGKSDKD